MVKFKGMKVTEIAYFIIFNAVSQFPQYLSLYECKGTERWGYQYNLFEFQVFLCLGLNMGTSDLMRIS